jgi:hypothetical protein
MNFNIYLKKETEERITQIAQLLHRSRHSIVNEALEEWLSKHSTKKWPENFFDFSPIKDEIDFKSLRNDLKDHISD